MRRLALVLAALAALTVAAPAAAGGPPTKTKLDLITLTAEDLAGTCDFPVQIADTFTNVTEAVWPALPNGDQRVTYGGGTRSTVTNLATGKTKDIRFFGHLEFWFHADGTVHVQTSGSVILWTTDDDVLSRFDGGIYLITGSIRSHNDANTFFALAPERVRGKVVDLCAAVA